MKKNIKKWFNYLNINNTLTTKNNLLNSANGENKEWKSIKNLLKLLNNEKNFDIAKKFEQITRIEVELKRNF